MAVETSDMSQMLEPLVAAYYDRKVKPAYVQALNSTKAAIDVMPEQGMIRNTLMAQLRDVSVRLDQAQSMSLIAASLGTDLNHPARQAIDRLANTVQRLPGGPQAAADLKVVSNLIEQRRVSEEMFK